MTCRRMKSLGGTNSARAAQTGLAKDVDNVDRDGKTMIMEAVK